MIKRIRAFAIIASMSSGLGMCLNFGTSGSPSNNLYCDVVANPLLPVTSTILILIGSFGWPKWGRLFMSLGFVYFIVFFSLLSYTSIKDLFLEFTLNPILLFITLLPIAIAIFFLYSIFFIWKQNTSN